MQIANHASDAPAPFLAQSQHLPLKSTDLIKSSQGLADCWARAKVSFTCTLLTDLYLHRNHSATGRNVKLLSSSGRPLRFQGYACVNRPKSEKQPSENLIPPLFRTMPAMDSPGWRPWPSPHGRQAAPSPLQRRRDEQVSKRLCSLFWEKLVCSSGCLSGSTYILRLSFRHNLLGSFWMGSDALQGLLGHVDRPS